MWKAERTRPPLGAHSGSSQLALARVGRRGLELSKSSPIGPSDSVQRENAFPLDARSQVVSGPGLGIARVGEKKKAGAGGAERSGHLCPWIRCQICSRVCLPVRPGGAGINRSMKGGLIYPKGGMMGVCVHRMCFRLVYVSACISLACSPCAETVCQVVRSYH